MIIEHFNTMIRLGDALLFGSAFYLLSLYFIIVGFRIRYRKYFKIVQKIYQEERCKVCEKERRERE